MTANPWRGEVVIMFDGKPHILRPTFAALNNIEQQLGLGLIALAGKLAAGNITLEELAVIIAACAIETPQNIQDALVRGGLANVVQSISHMFAMIFGGYDATDA